MRDKERIPELLEQLGSKFMMVMVNDVLESFDVKGRHGYVTAEQAQKPISVPPPKPTES